MHLETIKTILREEDILGLINPTGAPPDEYDGEAELFFQRHQEGSSKEEIEELIKQIFIEMFWEKYIIKRDFSKIAERLLKAQEEAKA